jgi:hypothetical protein
MLLKELEAEAVEESRSLCISEDLRWVYTVREIVLTKIVLGASEWIMSMILV